MKQKIKGFKGLLSILLCLVLIAQCVSVENISAATKVKINKTKASIYVGKTVQLKISGTKKKVTWKSSNKKVATVTSKGKVKGVKKGTAKITATVSKKKYVCKVTIKNKAVKVTPTPKPTAMVTPTVTSTVKPTPMPTIEPTKVVTLPPATPSSVVATTPTSEPTQAPVVTLGAIEACNIGESYTSKNGLNVCVNYVAGELFSGVCYICKINYAIKNNTSKTIKRPIFRVFSENGNAYYQNGTFNDLEPGKSLQSQYHVISMVMSSNPRLLEKPIILELVTDKDDTETNYKDTLNPNELHWIVP